MRYRYTIEAESEPTVLPRILALVACRNHVPTRANACRLAAGELRIVIEIDSLTEWEWEYLGKKFLAIPTVLSVERARAGAA